MINIDSIFDSFNADDDTALLIDFTSHPLYWINGFNKVISNYPYFKQHMVKMNKKFKNQLDENDIENASKYMMYDKAWEYIKEINIENQFHLECISKKSNLVMHSNLVNSIKHFEKLEHYEKCNILKKIEIKVKDFLL